MYTILAFLIGLIVGVYAYIQLEKKAVKQFDKNKDEI